MFTGTIASNIAYGNEHATREQIEAAARELSGASSREAPLREMGEKRRKEAEAVGRIFPGEGR